MSPAVAADVCAIVVTYQPQTEVIDRVLRAVAGQVGGVLLLDNASNSAEAVGYLESAEIPGVGVVRLSANVGLGRAFNMGTDQARQRGFRYVLLMDQDSVLAPGMVTTLRSAFESLPDTGSVAAVGPQFFDTRSGRPAPFVRLGFPFNRKLYGGPGQRVECDFLISSGSLLPLAALERVGGMDEGLFIDNVDLEWCFRARSRGLRLYGICDARMDHSIGDRLRRSRIKRDGVVIHSPLRLYYIMRNRLLLYRRAETPRVWIAQDLPRLLLKFFGMALFVAPRRAYLRSMLRGLWHGMRGVNGPMPP